MLFLGIKIVRNGVHEVVSYLEIPIFEEYVTY